MDAIRQIVDGRVLSGVISLPMRYRNTKVEIIVTPVREMTGKLLLSREEIDSMLKGTITETLVGAVPNRGETLEGYRAERLDKYDCAD